MQKIFLSKENYVEIVIRKSLYQFSRFCEWELIDDNINWTISLINSNNFLEDKNTFDRLLNDNLLRYEIDKNTFFLRKQIIKKSLEKIYCEL
jgi:His-Xaa-Ser system protein HxsD